MRTTSAPRSARIMQPRGAGPMPATSTTRMPCSGPLDMSAILPLQVHDGDVAGSRKYAKSLEDLERGVHVAVEDQVVEQPVDAPHDAIEPEELDRIRMLGVTAAG